MGGCKPLIDGERVAKVMERNFGGAIQNKVCYTTAIAKALRSSDDSVYCLQEPHNRA